MQNNSGSSHNHEGGVKVGGEQKQIENENQSMEKEDDKSSIIDERFRTEIKQLHKRQYSMDNFNDFVAAVYSNDILKQHQGIIGLRKVLSVDQNPPIQTIIDAGLVPKLMEYAKQFSYPQLKYEAAWALTNIASGTSAQCMCIIDLGGIPLFVELLQSSNMRIVGQAVWAIGNISSDSTVYRDAIIAAGAIPYLVEVIQIFTIKAFTKHCCWALSNLCRGSPLPKYENVRFAIIDLCQKIAQECINDQEIIIDCCWAISYHSGPNEHQIAAIVKTGVIPHIVKLLDTMSIGLLVPSIRILGNISSSQNSNNNDLLLSNNILALLESNLNHHKNVIRREASFVLSNLAAGTKSHAHALISSSGLIERALELFESDSNDVKRQLCFFFSNLALSGDPEEVFSFYVKAGILRLYADLLVQNDKTFVQVILTSLIQILTLALKTKNIDMRLFTADLRREESMEALEKLQCHQSDLVCGQVLRIFHLLDH